MRERRASRMRCPRAERNSNTSRIATTGVTGERQPTSAFLRRLEFVNGRGEVQESCRLAWHTPLLAGNPPTPVRGGFR